MDLLGPVEFDVTDADSALACIDAARPEVVYHLAALSHVGQSWSSPGRSFRVNAEGTLHVLRACLEAKVPRVVVILSSEVYGNAGPGAGPLREDAPLRPVTPYGASKAAADLVALQMHLADRLDVVRVRPFGHTGPGPVGPVRGPRARDAHRPRRARRRRRDPRRIARRGPRPLRRARRRARVPAARARGRGRARPTTCARASG